MNQNDFIRLEQFSLVKEKKRKYLLEFVRALHYHHLEKSDEYSRFCKAIFPFEDYASLDKLPYLPVSLFKNYYLKSIEDKDVFKVLTSSGTTGSVPSRIVLDKETASLQTLTLSKIMKHVIGKDRLPMLIVDSKSVIKDRKSFSARGAGILGISIFGKKHLYLLNTKTFLFAKHIPSSNLFSLA